MTDQWSAIQTIGLKLELQPAIVPRVIRHPDVRRAEFLDHAEALFLGKGYDSVSLNDVIAAARASKGAFYHWFPSKEALLEALVDRFAREIMAAAEGKDADREANALKRLNGFLARARRYKLDIASRQSNVLGSLGALFCPGNLALAERVNAGVAKLFVPALIEIISDGVSKGEFQTSDPAGIAEMMLQLTGSRHPLLAKAEPETGVEGLEAAVKALEKRFTLYGIAIDRLLGLADGSVLLLEPGYVRTLAMATLLPGAGHR